VNTAPQLSRLGKYRLIATIGHGGMAHIHLALMAGVAGFNKLLVIKALRDDVAASTDDFVTMFLDEARLAARLSHPNIVQTYEVGQSEGRFFIAMEYLEGQSMKTVERRLSPGGLPLPMHLRILSELAKGLHHAHSLQGFDSEHLGVVHRDVSPHNIFLTYDGQVKLLDFGIAKAANALHLTKVGVIKGKADYIAPEQIRGENVDCRADIFSLGVMMWEALAGKRFAGGPGVAEITKMHNRLTGGEAKLRDVNPEVPERLAQICERAIGLDPATRHQSALELSQDIDDYLADSSLYPNAKQLAELVAPPFLRERDQLRKLIDEQMKLALDPAATFDSTTGDLPVLPMPRVPQTSGIWNMPVVPDGSARLSPGSSASMPAQHITGSAFPEQKRRAPWPVVVAVMIVAVAGGSLLALRSNESMPAPVVAGAMRRPTETPPTLAPTRVEPGMGTRDPEPPTRTIRLRISAEPSSAQATLDGASISLPFDIEVPEARAAHEVVINADGFMPHRALLSYDRDQTLAVTLDPKTSGKRRSPTREMDLSTAPQPAQPSTPSAPAPAPATSAAKVNPELEPGMDFKRLRAGRPAAESTIVLEEDPYQ